MNGLNGFIRTENTQFLDDNLTFKVSEQSDEYPAISKKLGSFELDVEAGDFSDSDIIVMIGENGTGKTTMIRSGKAFMNICYKLQKISPKCENVTEVRKNVARKH
ncbi:unnamed protein product [Cylicocyclus nassatus]|uniref:Uncharacterized protein n=1 Tax=Cylicocyclus nassatus TaxID=53992 RepID=A0AA36M924_CYLNA|nr:unnamed protein product [Cylicocyclus nassatus]